MAMQTLDSILAGVLAKVKNWARINSPWAIHFNSGSCNGCDIQILATLTPRYDVERFGIKLQGSPRHADVLICTGPVTMQARDALLRIYEQMPDPKFVIAVAPAAYPAAFSMAATTSSAVSTKCFRWMCLFQAARRARKALFTGWRPAGSTQERQTS